MAFTNLYSVNYKVYVAGVEIPANSVMVNSSFNALPRCTVSLDPDARLFGIGRKDRVPLQVFIENSFANTLGEYLLFFEGEIDSSGYTNTKTGREFVLNAHGIMAFMQDVLLHLVTNLEEFRTTLDPGDAFSRIQLGTQADFAFPVSLFMRGLTGTQTIRYPSEFLANALSFLSKENDTTSVIGAFYRQYLSDWKIDQRYTRLPFFDDEQGGLSSNGFPILAGVSKAALLSQLSGMATEALKLGNLFDLITFIACQMEYEFAFFHAPTKSSNALHSMCMKPMLYEALPPRCNIIPRCLVDNVSISDKVYGVPTRIRTRDQNSAAAVLALPSQSGLANQVVLQYYPRRNVPQEKVPSDSNQKGYSYYLLDEERKTGPIMFDTAAPAWMSFVGADQASELATSYGDQIRSSMLTLKQAEATSMQVSMAFNPYVVTGFPGVVYDNVPADSRGFTFVGQVLSATHLLSKGNASTSLELSFVRTLADAYQQGAPTLKNSFEDISTKVTHNWENISGLYEHLIGCSAASFSEIEMLAQGNEQEDVSRAYQYMQRDICTEEEYFDFVGGRDATIFTDRRDTDLRKTLKSIAARIKEEPIYQER